MKNLITKRLAFSLALVFLAMIVAVKPVHADEKESEEEVIVQPEKVDLGRPVSFSKDILPIFKAKCLACHSSSEAEYDVNLESVATIMKGGGSDELVVSSDPDKSMLYKVVTRDADSPMPPIPNEAQATILTPKEVGLIRLWIQEGAKADPKGMVRKINWRPVPEQVKAIYSVDVDQSGRFVAYGRANQIFIQDLLHSEQSLKLVDPNLTEIKFGENPMYPGGASHRDSVYSLNFSDDGEWLASGGYRVVKLWKRASRTPNHSIKSEQAPVTAIVSPDGSLLFEAGQDHVIRIRQLSDGNLVSELKGHTDLITGLALRSLSEDYTNADLNKKLAALELVSVSKDQAVKVWNLAQGQLNWSLKTPSPSGSVLFNQDGKQVLTAGTDGVIRIWNNDPALYQDETKPPAPVSELKGHSGPINAMASVDGQASQIITGSEDGTVRLWNLEDGKELQNLNHQAPVTAVAATATGSRVASSGGNVVRLWNLADGKQVTEIKGDHALNQNLLKSGDLVTVAKEHVAHLTSIVQARDKDVKDREETIKKSKTRKEETAKKITEEEGKLKTEEEAVAKLKGEAPKPEKDPKEMNEEEKKAFQAKEDEYKKKLEEAEKKLQAAKEALEKAKQDDESAARAITLNEKSLEAANKRLEEAMADEKAEQDHQKALEGNQAGAQTAFNESMKNVSSLQFSANGKSLLTSGDLNVIQIWSAESGKFVDAFNAHSQPVIASQLLGDGKLVSVSSDQNVFVWNTNPSWEYAGVLGPESEKPLEVETSLIVDRVMALDFSPNGKLLATAGGAPSRDGELIIWDLENKKILHNIEKAHSDTVMGVEFSFDGKKLASASSDKFVKVFNTETGEYVRSYEGHTNYVLDVSWKADSLSLVSAGADNVIKIWNAETGEQRRTISGFGKQVASIQFVGVGETFVTCSGDHLVRVYKMSDGKNTVNFTGATEFAHAVASSSNGNVVVSGGQDGILRIWQENKAEPVKTLTP